MDTENTGTAGEITLTTVQNDAAANMAPAMQAAAPSAHEPLTDEDIQYMWDEAMDRQPGG